MTSLDMFKFFNDRMFKLEAIVKTIDEVNEIKNGAILTGKKYRVQTGTTKGQFYYRIYLEVI